MPKENKNILIIGGGLSGLTLAYLLSKKKIGSTILEASSRLGGRIETIKGANETPLELGATWFSGMHTQLIALLDDLDIQKFPQYTKGKSIFQTTASEPVQEFFVSETESPSYRIAGGSQKLIDTLRENLDPKNIKLKTRAVSIQEIDNKILIDTNTKETFTADHVILCLPPQLIASQIKFSPDLPQHVLSVLPLVQTWMAGSIKFVLEYATPFWRDKGFSGMLFSHSGIVSELHDHTNIEENKFGFTGFLDSNTASQSQELRKELALNQLQRHLGIEARTPLLYSDKIWMDEFVSTENQNHLVRHQYNGHPIFNESYLNNTLYFCGTEASMEFSGYMEGAVRSAINTYRKIAFSLEH